MTRRRLLFTLFLILSFSVSLLTGLWALKIATASGSALGLPSSSTSVAVVDSSGSEESEITNSLGMRFRLVRAGTFRMGTDEPHPANFNADTPSFKVTLTEDYYIGVHEVTQAQFERIMGSNPSKYKGPNRPVDSVSCAQAIEFCRRLSEIEGVTYRLPYEAEWEYACRAGTTTSYYWGSEVGDAGEHEWHSGNSGGTTHDVGMKKANPWGLFDMSGNVQEFCLDYLGEYPSSDKVDYRGPDEVGQYGLDCTLRGGYYCNYKPENLAVTHRHGYVRDDPDNNPFFGFRCIREK